MKDKKKNKLLSLNEDTIKKLKYLSSVMSLSESMTTRIAIGILHNKVKNDFEGIENFRMFAND